MNIRPQVLATAIDDLIFAWQKHELVLDSRKHKIYRKGNGINEVTWGNDGYILKDEKFCSLSEYAALLENRQYSMLLSDGSLFQFSFSFSRELIVKHRLCWYPAPIAISPQELETSDIQELILNNMKDANLENFLSRSPIRFDYSESDGSDDHPEVHLHVSVESCRIPVRTPLCLNKFLMFVVENFYPELPRDSPLTRQAKTWAGKDTLTASQKAKMHINIFN